MADRQDCKGVTLYLSDTFVDCPPGNVLARDIVLGSLGGFCFIFLLLLPLDFLLYMRKNKKRRRWLRHHGEFARHKMYVPVNMYGVVRAAINDGLATAELSRDRSVKAMCVCVCVCLCVCVCVCVCVCACVRA